jgi:hypothetical protein
VQFGLWRREQRPSGDQEAGLLESHAPAPATGPAERADERGGAAGVNQLVVKVVHIARADLGRSSDQAGDVFSDFVRVDVVVAPGARWSEHDGLVERTDRGGCRDPDERHRDDPDADGVRHSSVEQVIERPFDVVDLLCRVGERDDQVILVGENGVDVRPVAREPVSQPDQMATRLHGEVGPQGLTSELRERPGCHVSAQRSSQRPTSKAT